MNSPQRPSLRQEMKELTRTRLLDAAIEVLSENPGMQVTMESIARSAGVTRATLYAHFQSKSDILRALSERLYLLGDEVYTALSEISVWSEQSLRGWLDVLIARWRSEAVPIRVLMISGAGADGDTAQAPHRHYVELLSSDRERWASVTPAEAEQRSLMFLIFLESFLTTWIAGNWSLGTDDPAELLADELFHILRPALRSDVST